MLLVLLATTGFAISSYFTSVFYRWLRPDARWIPPVCRMDEQTCASVIFTPNARVFGVPNSLLGQAYYLALLIATASGLLDHAYVWRALLLASAGSVCLAVYLSYSLLFLLRLPCPLCFTSHGINITICILLLTSPPAL